MQIVTENLKGKEKSRLVFVYAVW